MPRSKLETLIYATILTAPMAVATAYLALAPAPIVMHAAVDAPACIVEPGPTPAIPEPPPAPPVAAELPAEPSVSVEVVAVEDAPVAAAPGAGLGLLMYEGQVVLATAPDITWSKGQLRDLDTKNEYSLRVSKRVAAERLPGPLRALADARMIVHAADGSTCVASTRASDLTIYGRQDGELLYPAEGEEEVSAEQRRSLLEAVFADAQLLRARLHRASGEQACQGLWARPAALPAPAVFAPGALDLDAEAPLRAQILTQLAATPAVQAMARAYRQHMSELEDDRVPWSTYMRDTLRVTRWDEVGGPRSVLNVIVGDGGEPCSSEFYEQTALLFALEDGVPVPLPDAGFIDPMAMMDLERDGHLEAITRGGLLLESRGPAGTVQGFEIPFHGCPC